MLNQYTTVGGTARTHDSNGNLTDDGTYLFGYDFQNRLVELKNKSTSAVIATYRYDALGRRVEKAVVGGATTRYILDGVQVMEEYDGSNAWQARYVYEDGIDQPRCMDRADIADVNGNSNTTEMLRFHYHQQALGCVTEITQPTGAVVEWVTYDVYGQPTIRDINGTVDQARARWGIRISTRGASTIRSRGSSSTGRGHYDPGTGRFLQRDPAGSGRAQPLRVRSDRAFQSLGSPWARPERRSNSDTCRRSSSGRAETGGGRAEGGERVAGHVRGGPCGKGRRGRWSMPSRLRSRPWRSCGRTPAEFRLQCRSVRS